MRFPSCRTQHTQRNGRKACDEIKRNARNQFYPCVRCIFRVRALRFFYLICVAWPACVASVALRTAAWTPTSKSVFVGLHTVLKLSYATQRTQRHARLVTQSTRSSAVAERPRDASCLSVVSFNIPTVRFFNYQLLRLQIYYCMMVKKFWRYPSFFVCTGDAPVAITQNVT